MSAKQYREKVRALDCLLCWELNRVGTPAETHHVFDSAARSDFLIVPLCPEHHRGATGFHGLGQRAFERIYRMTECDLLAWTIERVNSRAG